MKTKLIRTRCFFYFGFCKEKSWAAKSCLMLFLLLSLGQIVFPNIAISRDIHSERESHTKHLEALDRDIKDIKAGKRIMIGAIMGWLNEYREYLSGDVRGDVMGSSSPDKIYENWTANRRLEVLHKVITLLDVAKQYKHISIPEIEAMEKFHKLLNSIKKEAEEAINSGNKHLLRISYWRLRFIEPAPGVKEMLASVETKTEIESVKDALRDSIAKGETNIELENRIAKLPKNAKKDVEDLRGKLLDDKARQLAMAKEEEAKREKALRRQQEIDQAIKLRKEEIDSDKTNPTLQQQLSGDPELKSAVALWETQYRKELADKKAWEAKKKLEEIELAKAREAERLREKRALEEKKKEEDERWEKNMKAREAERLKEEKEKEVERKKRELDRAKQEEAARRKQAKLAKYNVKAEVSAVDLCKNPFQFEGKVILLTGARYDRMLEKGLAVFTVGWPSEKELLVSRVPVDFNKEYANLIVKCKGNTKATTVLGAVITLPLVEYVDVLQ